MPLIIDASCAKDFSPPVEGHAVVILQKIKNRQIKLAVGGEVLRELVKTSATRSLLVNCERVGLLIRANDEDLEVAKLKIDKIGIESNDCHVLALAEVSGARLLYTDDKALMRDFRNGALLRPRGRICAFQTRPSAVISLLDRFGG